jgi:hypothetical protein
MHGDGNGREIAVAVRIAGAVGQKSEPIVVEEQLEGAADVACRLSERYRLEVAQQPQIKGDANGAPATCESRRVPLEGIVGIVERVARLGERWI